MNGEQRHLFTVAICAFRFDPEANVEQTPEGVGTMVKLTTYSDPTREGAAVLNSTFGLHTILALTETHERARELGLREARARWPEADGWAGHTAATGQIARKLLTETFRIIADDAEGEGEDGETDLELIM
jgi:hypothetical protein